MTFLGWFQIILFCAIVVALVVPLGWYMTRVFNGERTFLSPVLQPVEVALYRLGGVDEKHEQHWLTYTVAMLLFHVGGFLILFLLMRFQAVLPFNPAEQSAGAPDLAFNTAVSFITNTNWQNYGGESTMSYLVQMLGLTHQNFLSAATGIVLAVALIRGFARASARTIGNFWVDITRCTLYILRLCSATVAASQHSVPGRRRWPCRDRGCLSSADPRSIAAARHASDCRDAFPDRLSFRSIRGHPVGEHRDAFAGIAESECRRPAHSRRRRLRRQGRTTVCVIRQRFWN